MATIRIQIENGDVKISLGTSGKETITLDTENAASAVSDAPPKKSEKPIAPPASAAPASAAKRKRGRPKKASKESAPVSASRPSWRSSTQTASPKQLASQIETLVRSGDLPKEAFSRGDVCKWFSADKRHASAALKSLMKSGLLGMRGERATAMYFPKQEARVE